MPSIPDAEAYATALHAHVHAFFGGHDAISRSFLGSGRIYRVVPVFQAIEVAPGPKSTLWTYVSVGAGLIEGAEGRTEFLITAAVPSQRHVDLLAMTTYYHSKEALGLGHTCPIGEPWIPESTLDHFLISLPYPFGEGLEVFSPDSGHVRLLWLLPITKAERDFKVERGLEALESRFEEVGLHYWDARRKSAI